MSTMIRATAIACAAIVYANSVTFGQAATRGGESSTDERPSTVGAVAGPEAAEAAVLVVHDWFGVTDFTHQTVTRLASLGYRTLAVDLYGGESADTHERANELMSNLDPGTAEAILRDGLRRLSSPGRRIAVIGFSMGGAHAFRLAASEPAAVAAAVVFYGGGLETMQSDLVGDLAGPVLVITGSGDQWALASALEILPRMRDAEKAMELYVYPGADHAYAQPLFNSGANYDAVATRVTWRVVEDFLARHLRDES